MIVYTCTFKCIIIVFLWVQAPATPTRAPLPQENIYDTLAPKAGELEVTMSVVTCTHIVAMYLLCVYRAKYFEFAQCPHIYNYMLYTCMYVVINLYSRAKHRPLNRVSPGPWFKLWAQWHVRLAW